MALVISKVMVPFAKKQNKIFNYLPVTLNAPIMKASETPDVVDVFVFTTWNSQFD